MALSVEDFLYIQNTIGFPKNIQIARPEGITGTL
jgi:hypothetical protein